MNPGTVSSHSSAGSPLTVAQTSSAITSPVPTKWPVRPIENISNDVDSSSMF